MHNACTCRINSDWIKLLQCTWLFSVKSSEWTVPLWDYRHGSLSIFIGLYVGLHELLGLGLSKWSSFSIVAGSMNSTNTYRIAALVSRYLKEYWYLDLCIHARRLVAHKWPGESSSFINISALLKHLHVGSTPQVPAPDDCQTLSVTDDLSWSQRAHISVIVHLH